MTLIAILLAAAAGFGLGAVWFGAFGARWMAAVPMTEEERRANASRTPYVVAAVAALLTSAMLWHVFAASGVSGFVPGLVGGFGAGAFIVAPWIAMNHAFAGRARDLTLIDGGYAVLACSTIGAVLGLFL